MTNKLKVRPMFDSIVTTANRSNDTDGGLIIVDNIGGQGKLKTTQIVLRVGENVPSYIKEGTEVELNMSTFPRKAIAPKNGVGDSTYEVEPPLYATKDGVEFMLMSVRNLLYIVD